MVTLIAVAGTHGGRHEKPWFHWGSDWWNEAERRGAQRAAVDRRRWGGEIDGIFGENENWIIGGEYLWDFIVHSCNPSETVIVAHSHGGTVVGEAICGKMKVKALITLGTPVRRDTRLALGMMAEAAEAWTHIYSPSDWWQLLGGIGDGHFSLRRKMRHAHRNIRVKGLSHADLHSVKAWKKNGWWDLVFGEAAPAVIPDGERKGIGYGPRSDHYLASPPCPWRWRSGCRQGNL